MATKQHTHNGVNFSHISRGKWQFSGIGKDGKSFTTYQFANGVERAYTIAGHVAGSLKRKAGEIDAMARSNISKVISARQYRGIDFSASTAEKTYGYGPSPVTKRKDATVVLAALN